MANLKSNSIRIFVTLWLCSILIITVGWVVTSWKNKSLSTNVFRYSRGLISVLTVPLVPISINSISELADYPLPVSSFSDTFYKLANQSLDSNLQKIADDYIVHYDFDQAITNASSSKVVMAESKQLLEYIVR